MKSLDRIYGMILIAEKKDSQQLFNEINPKWNSTNFQNILYEAISKLIEKGQDLNILNISLHWKEENIFNHKNIARLSELTADLPISAFLTVKQALASIKYSKDLERAKNTANKILNLVDSQQYTNDSFLDIIAEASEDTIETTDNKVTNQDLIFDILNKHEAAKKGEQTGFNLGFSTLRKVVNLEPVDMMVIGARPAMGKTAFAVEVCTRLAKNGKKVLLFSLEMSAQQMMRRIVGNLAEIDTNKIKFGECSEAELKSIYQVQEQPFMENIIIKEGSHNIRQISQAVNDLKIKDGLDVFIVDYLQKVMPTRSNGSRYEQVTQVSNGLKYISQNLKIPSICLAQLNRENARTGKLPSLPDLKESGEIEQDASIVAFLHRPEYYGESETSNGNPSENICEFLVAKNREGVVDKFELEVSLKNSSFKDVDQYEMIKRKLSDDTPF